MYTMYIINMYLCNFLNYIILSTKAKYGYLLRIESVNIRIIKLNFETNNLFNFQNKFSLGSSFLLLKNT